MLPNFDAMYIEHRARLVRRAHQYVGHDDAQAEDLAQVALLKAWEALPDAEFGPDGLGVAAWLNTILDRTALDYLRHKKRRPEIAFSDLVSTDDDREARGVAVATITAAASGSTRNAGGADIPTAYDAGPEHVMAQVLDFKRAEAKLTAAQRDALKLAAIGHTFAESAAMLKCTQDAARDRVRRARAMLMECAA